MLAELGQFSLALALTLAVVQAVLPLAGAAQGRSAWMAVAAPAAQAQALFVLIAFACLAASFLDNDFSVRAVALHSNSRLPTEYRFAAVWGSHEGSMLLWVLFLGAWSVAVTLFSRDLPLAFAARVLGVMGIISAGLLGFMVLTSNPFLRQFPAPPEGRDLNPLLQDPGMVIHPPMLYMGYVGFSVAFAFAIAALLSGRVDAAWARWSRPWSTLAWMFLTLGIAIGAGWAYYELGWGGWWFWDPVENASLMPWLAGTALIHSLAMTEKRGVCRNWTVLLALATFSLSLLGTFLVRSGVLTSVHAFATDPRRGLYILVFLVLVVGSSLALFAWRAPRIGLGASFSAVSRESLLLANNLVLSVAAASVLLGTLYPLALDALGLGKISVGPQYFDTVFVPLCAPALFLMGAAPFARWREAQVADVARRLRWAAVAGLLAAAAQWVSGGSLVSALGTLLAAWIAGSVLVSLRERLTLAGRLRLAQARRIPAGEWGMLLAHLGVGVLVFGITMVKTWEVQRDVRMQVSESAQLGGYTFRLDGVEEFQGPNYLGLRLQMEVSRDGKPVARMEPQKRLYTAQRMPMTEAAIDVGWDRDLYVSVGEELSPGVWAVRLQVKPFIDWLWGGAVLMALGALVAAGDRRYRTAPSRRPALVPAADAVADGGVA